MTIAYGMNYADGSSCPNVTTSDFSVPNHSFAYPQYFEELPGMFSGSAAVDNIGTPNGRRSHLNDNNKSTSGWSCFDTTPFGGLGDISMAFAGCGFSPTHTPIRSPSSIHNRARSESAPRTESNPSFEDHSRAASPQKSTSPYLDDLPNHHGKESSPTAPSRKRGRPRLHPTSSASAEEVFQLRNAQRSSCVPHKHIERKYREGLNMEFERLRRAVPTLPQCTEANVIGATKPSKGMVLAAAIDYIGRIERERDAAIDEIERLGGTFRSSKLNGSHADRRMF